MPAHWGTGWISRHRVVKKWGHSLAQLAILEHCSVVGTYIEHWREISWTAQTSQMQSLSRGPPTLEFGDL